MGAEKVSVKALALISGGLDSLLAARVVRNLGVEVTGITFQYRFDLLEAEKRTEHIRKVTEAIGIPLLVYDLTEAFMPVFLDPPHGYGSAVNPCIDCHLLMFSKAREEMERMGARFIVTGEVMGQRPMSQHKPVLAHMDRVSGMKGLILRPLCALKLPPTIPEERGWVKREALYGFSGRSRKPQLELAKELGVTGYQSPAGGCILTDPEYARRVKAFFKHRGKEAMNSDEMRLLRLGRQFWIDDGVQVIVGRNEKDNDLLEPFRKGCWALEPEDRTGPLVLVQGLKNTANLENAARITARYCKGGPESPVTIRFSGGGEEGLLHVLPAEEEILEKWRI
jgi:tRNA U34 2-thiouridine synthase MnmA/TrmU